MEFIFVYNKLRGYSGFEEFIGLDIKLGKRAKTKGRIFDYNGDACMIPDNTGTVYGNLMVATDIDKLLRKFDIFMEHIDGDYSNSKTLRGQVEVELGGKKMRAWCYVYPLSMQYEFEKKGIEIKKGDYLEYLKEKEGENV